MKYPHARLLIFSKAPQPGQVKTRLIPLLGSAGAASLYRKFLEDVLARMTVSRLCPVELHCDPDAKQEFFQHCRRQFPITLCGQTTGDLGQRMSQALHRCIRQNAPAVLIGADCPTLTAADVEMALEQLAGGSDLVIGPSPDGGYYLIGMQAHHAGLFTGIPWGTDRVLECTLQQARNLGLQYRLLEARNDIDTPDDYLAWLATSKSISN